MTSMTTNQNAHGWRLSVKLATILFTLNFAPTLARAGSVETGLHTQQSAEIATWIEGERKTSVEKMFANISRPDVRPGVVIASPEKVAPNYYFHWTRDSALVMDTVVRSHIPELQPERRSKMMMDYIDFSRENQLTSSMTGLGEPKFNVDGTPFFGPWARPQNDGPALRALTLTRYANELISLGQSDVVTKKLYNSEMPATTVIKTDLEYVANNWRHESFDVWEESRGDHFYTRMVQISAMREGAKLAARMNDPGAAFFYNSQAADATSTLPSFWRDEQNFLNCTNNHTEGAWQKQAGIDSAVILGVLHADLTEGDFTAMDPRVLATANKIEETFSRMFAINQSGRYPGAAPAIGRYPEDKYSGASDSDIGHAWFLTTAAMAEVNYRVAAGLSRVESFPVTKENVGFIRSAMSGEFKDVEVGMTFRRENGELAQLANELFAKGDAFMKRIRYHVDASGSMSEQFDRDSGFMKSARDLTWSYAAFITAVTARERAAQRLRTF